MMNSTRCFHKLCLTLSIGLFASSVIGDESLVLRTNWVEKSITNVVEVRMPKNVFVDEFRTNWIDEFTTNTVAVYKTNRVNRFITNETVIARAQTIPVQVYRTNWIGKALTNDTLVTRYRTNVVDHYHTNVVTKNLTNEIPVSLVQTNLVDHFNTNWTTQFLTNEIAVNLVRTNLVDQHRTNWTTRHLTNEIAINLVHTNLVDRYRTNLKILSLTNWQTVLIMKTNWVTEPVTNLVQIDLPLSQKPGSKVEAGSPSSSALAAAAPDEATIEAVRTRRAAANNTYEIVLRIKWPAAAPDQVQHWWIEREDGAYLSVGQDREFKRELPAGTYKVEAKVQHDPDSSVLTLRGTMIVTARDVVVRPRSSGKKLAAN